MIDKTKILEAIRKLEVELRLSKKEEIADFYKKIGNRINDESDLHKLKDCLEQLRDSGAISQYANFTYTEDTLFEEIYKETTELLDQIE